MTYFSAQPFSVFLSRVAACIRQNRLRCVFITALFSLLLIPSTLFAHASEQAFVLLLPTGVYISSGVLAVVLTILLLALLPAQASHRILASKAIWKRTKKAVAPGQHDQQPQVFFSYPDLVSLCSAALLFALIVIGFIGSHDPLKNPLPLFIWTLWWIGFVVVQGLLGNIWQYLNPWTGPYRLVKKLTGSATPIDSTPAILGVWPGIVCLLAFTLFALADIAPDNPQRLSMVVGVYWLSILVGMLLFGERWLHQAECFTILLKLYAQLAPFGRTASALKIGVPGWKAIAKPTTTVSGAIFILFLLGTGSFDGFNETFYWLHLIGINPLAFPGRSAVVLPTTVGLLAANFALLVIYAMCVYVGVLMANKHSTAADKVSFQRAFTYLSIAILPIAFVYHFAHFLTAFMVNVQYSLAAASDPLDSGIDLLGLGTFYVTTGYMNSHHTVEAIWLTQAVAVVLGHVLSVLLAHALALDLFGQARRAIISQVPLAAFMVVYTFIGLWLLAAPRGA